jgi:hypothetical protein
MWSDFQVKAFLGRQGFRGLRDAIRRTTSAPLRQITRRGWTQKHA